MSMTFDFNDQTYELSDLTMDERKVARTFYNKTFYQALNDGCFLQSQTIEKAKEIGLWDDKQDKKLESLQTELSALLKKLEEGGYNFEEAVEDAIKAKELRNEIFTMNMIISEFMSHSAERQAENMEADYVLWCRLKQKGKKLYRTFEEFLSKKDDDPIITAAVLHEGGIDNSFIKSLPENEFLLEFGRMNDNLEVLDKDGKPITEVEFAEPVKRKPFKGAPKVKTE